MRYLVDTDWVAEYLVEREPAVTLLAQLAADGIAISLMTYGEIYEGIYYGRDPERAEAIFRAFLRGVDVLALTRPILRRFASVRGDLRRRGQIIGDPDILIAATALHHSLQLVTRNARDFGRIEDLVLYPSP
jgi:predicted nucleic acid-binding protein